MERDLLFGEVEHVLAAAVRPVEHELPSTTLSGGGTIHYVDLTAGKLKFPNSAIYIPGDFKVGEEGVDVILYFHGLIIDACSGDPTVYGRRGMKSYLEGNKFFQDLCPIVSASGKQVIFIAVTWLMKLKDGKYAYEGKAGHRNNIGVIGFNALLDSCLAKISGLLPTPFPLSIRTIVLAAHSAGGAPMQRIIGGVDGAFDQRYWSKVKECWGFDSQYTTATKAWATWLAGSKERVYRHYSVGRVLPREHDVVAFKKKYPKHSVPPYMNVSNLWFSLLSVREVDGLQYSFSSKKTSHCAMVNQSLGECLANSLALR